MTPEQLHLIRQALANHCRPARTPDAKVRDALMLVKAGVVAVPKLLRLRNL